MDQTFMTIIAIVAGIIIMVVIPMSAISQNNLHIAQSQLQAATAEFADSISTSGKITRESYSAFAQKVNSIVGTAANIEIEIQHLDENTGKKTATTSETLAGENTRYSTWDVEEKLRDNPEYRLGKGDKAVVKASAERKALFSFSTTDLEGSAESMVVNSQN